MQVVFSIRTEEALRQLLSDNLENLKVAICNKALKELEGDYITHRIQNKIKDKLTDEVKKQIEGNVFEAFTTTRLSQRVQYLIQEQVENSVKQYIQTLGIKTNELIREGTQKAIENMESTIEKTIEDYIACKMTDIKKKEVQEAVMEVLKGRL